MKKQSGGGILNALKLEFKYDTDTDDNKSTLRKAISRFISEPNFRANVYINYMQTLDAGWLKRLVRNHLETKYSIVIGIHCKLGSHFRAVNTVGIVISDKTIMGDCCKMHSGATIGQKDGFVPKIGNHVEICSGAIVIGKIEVGDNATIFANSVVNKNVNCGVCVAGIPAKNVSEN